MQLMTNDPRQLPLRKGITIVIGESKEREKFQHADVAHTLKPRSRSQ